MLFMKIISISRPETQITAHDNAGYNHINECIWLHWTKTATLIASGARQGSNLRYFPSTLIITKDLLTRNFPQSHRQKPIYPRPRTEDLSLEADG
jgi:hypothetical protein